MRKTTHDFPFVLLIILAVINNLKPEFLIPGLSSNTIIRQIPNLLGGLLTLSWMAFGQKISKIKKLRDCA
jgi:hypothetical protein